MKGVVKYWDDTKGYGFITTEHGEDIFAHISDIEAEGFQKLNKGETVNFEIKENAKGFSAMHIIPDRLVAAPIKITKKSLSSLKSPPEITRALRVFLCHSSGDKPIVRSLYHRLLTSNFIDPWLDEEKLLPGQDWKQEISKAVSNAEVVLICLSKGSINKAGYVQKEIKRALDVADEQPEGTIYLIPLKLEECDIPERLNRWQWVNLFETNGYERLMSALQHRASSLGIALHTDS